LRRFPFEILRSASQSGRQVLWILKFYLVKATEEIIIIKKKCNFRWGQTPKDEAVRFNHTAVAELIQSYIDKKPVAEEPVEDTKAKSKDQGSIGSIF
jgi:hypothetical protein